MIAVLRSFACLSVVTARLATAAPSVGPGDPGDASAESAPASARPELEIEDITVTAPDSAKAAPAETWNVLSEARVERSDPRHVADVLRRAPGALVQTNSRGETLVFLRNAGERQVSVFLDGAPLEVAWDHRLDLRMVPATAIGRTEVARGPLSNRYGPNISGGAVFLAPRIAEGTIGRLNLEIGGQGHWSVKGAVGLGGHESSLMVAAEHTEHEGEALAEALPFSQSDDNLRTNTDSARTSVLAHGKAELGDVQLGVTALYGRAVLGVAPESHLDPEVDPVRFWRYPNSELAMLIGSVGANGDIGAFDAVVWWQAFDQTIESFTSATYGTLDERQRDTNRSVGSRARATAQWGAHRLSLGAFGRLAWHDERRTRANDGGVGGSPERDAFFTGLWSTGLDYELVLNRTRLRIGGGVDALEPFDTSGRPSGGAFRAWNATGGVVTELMKGLSAHAAVGSRARLPTPRELFGTALDRFVVNDDLRSERNTTVEAGLKYARDWGALEVVPFATWTTDTIDQQNVQGPDGVRRQRVNRKGSRVLGVEVIGDVMLADWVRIAGQVLLSDVRRFGGGGDRLTERPGIQGFGELVFGYREGPALATEVFLRGPAYSLAPEGLRRTEGAALWNARLTYRLDAEAFGRVQLYFRLDNVFDTRLEPQLGLPEPGLQFRAGLTLVL